MTKRSAEPDEMRMPADQFDEMMRHALGAPQPSERPKVKPKPRSKKVASPPNISREGSKR